VTSQQGVNIVPKCNYDNWTTPTSKTVTAKMRKTLKVMADGRRATRANMLRAAGIEPNPRTAMGYAGFERTDYYLYRLGYLRLAGLVSGQKVFQITPEGSAIIG
jgi:hypothetical protein